jgi:simple sugar transport system permease protein
LAWLVGACLLLVARDLPGPGLVAGVWWLLYRTRFGLRLRAAGENPIMVDAAGVSVLGLRYQALALNGLLSGLAGAYLVLAQNPSFIPHMTAGRGYMALAALIFGKWHPLGVLGATLLFGAFQALETQLGGGQLLPPTVVQSLPFILTLLVLAGFVGRAIPPQAVGKPFEKS